MQIEFGELGHIKGDGLVDLVDLSWVSWVW